jgi:hypothetical protein
MRAPNNISFLPCLLLALCLVLIGCFNPRTSSNQAALIERMNSRQPFSLYLLASPHARLYVEIDAVEGCEPSDGDLAKLRDFLADCCNKPGGVEVVRDDVIPRTAARGISPEALARKYVTGPPESKNPGPAFLYVLCHDNPLSAGPAVWETGHPALARAATAGERTRNPRVNLLLPTMILMNMRHASAGEAADMLKHEPGHVMGLGCRDTGAAHYHCAQPACLMYSTFPGPITRLFLSKESIQPKKLCRQCLAQLDQAAHAAPATNLQFCGPVLVRREAGYAVLSVAGRTRVLFSDWNEQDCREFTTALQGETPVRGGGSGWRSEWSAKPEALQKPAELAGTLHAAEEDPYQPVREVAASAWDKVIQAYRAHGENPSAEILSNARHR